MKDGAMNLVHRYVEETITALPVRTWRYSFWMVLRIVIKIPYAQASERLGKP